MSYIVIGIQHAGDVLSQVSVQNSLNVATNIDCKGKITVYVNSISLFAFNRCRVTENICSLTDTYSL